MGTFATYATKQQQQLCLSQTLNPLPNPPRRLTPLRLMPLHRQKIMRPTLNPIPHQLLLPNPVLKPFLHRPIRIRADLRATGAEVRLWEADEEVGEV